MTAATGGAPVGGASTPAVRSVPRRPGVRATWRVETAKIAAQVPARAVLLLCVVAPPLFGALLHASDSLPSDTLFGRYVHDAAMAIPLVVLGFAGSWALPAVVSLVAGDVLSGEDAHGTWPTLLTRSASRRAVVAGKVLAAAGCTVLAVALLAASSVLSGELFGGAHALIGLSGQSLPGGAALARTALAWAAALPATLAFGAVALLVSAVTRHTVAAVAVPVLLGLAGQLVVLVDGAQPLAAALPGAAYTAWYGLFTDPLSIRPLVVAELVALAWCAGATALAWAVVRRRDVTS